MTQPAEKLEDVGAVEIGRIMQMIPHRYPFLMIDRVIEIRHNESAVGIKNVSINEPFFQGHFPGHPVMPGVLIVEALAQTAGCLFQMSAGNDGSGSTEGNPIYYLVKIDNARFNAMVVPGDQVRMEVTLKRLLRGMGIFEARALVDGNEVASCQLMCAGRAD